MASMRLYDERRRIDVLATVVMPILALAAAVVTAFLAGCTGPAYGASAAPHPFAATAIRFVPDEAALRGDVSLLLAGVDLEQNRFALRVGGIDPAEAADRLSFDTAVARLDRVATKLHFTALTPGATRIELSPEGGRPVGGTLVVE